MNEKKICFIICSNDEQQLEECMMYLGMLSLPEGYETDVLVVTDAKSMCAGYNEAMRASDAKYKVYLHQDTFIVNKEFLYDLLEVFKKDSKIGLLGMVGAETLSEDAVMWHRGRCGNFYGLKDDDEHIIRLQKEGKYVEVVDGFLMATQYDIAWREDILKGWDFYDVSQCLEFRRLGYKIFVPAQKSNWVIHDCGIPSFWKYNEDREIIVNEYADMINKKNIYRILFLHSDHISLITLAHALQNMGHVVDIYDYQVSLTDNVSIQWDKLEETIEERNYDFLITFNFSPTVAEASKRTGVKYFAYCYDNPLLELYREEVSYPDTYIGVFDKKQYDRLKSLHIIKNIMYVPLATNTDIFRNTVIGSQDRRKYCSDISFVGKLYDDIEYNDFFDDGLVLKKEADELLTSLAGKWNDTNTLFDKASKELIEFLYSRSNSSTAEVLPIDKRYYVESFILAKHLNEIERKFVINKLAERFDVKVYGSKKNYNDLNPNVRFGDYVDYNLEMPKVFFLSKINLNISSRSIESGIPQRVWDILAVSGFCLTNWQPELEDFFKIGKDLEVFRDIDELIDKASYYLKHDDKRTKIRLNGHNKIEKHHTYQKRMKPILERMREVPLLIP